MDYQYKEVDLEGLEVLDAISGAHKFNKWMYETISPYCKGEILEIGSGLGNISRFFIEDNQDIHLSDIRDNYLSFLKNKFNLSNIKISKIDIADVNFEKNYAHFLNKFDSIFCLNVVEHIKDDKLALSNILKMLKPAGQAVILVPAYQKLFNKIDTSLQHFRRYTKKTLKNIVPYQANFLKSLYFNAMGIPGWFFWGKVFKQDLIHNGEMKLYDRFVPLWKLLDKLINRRVGLSVIVIFQKK